MLAPHRLIIWSCLALWAVFPANAKTKPANDARTANSANPAGGKRSPMTQRILFHPSPTTEWLKGLQVEILGKIPKGTWLAADDATALELLKRDKSTLALYPTRADYTEAMEGLTESEKAEVVQKMHAILSADPKSFSMPSFNRSSMSRLSACASGSEAPGAAGQAMKAAFARELSILLVMHGGEDAGGAGAVPFFSASFDPLNELNWEEEVLRRHVGDALPPMDSALEKSRRELTLQLELAEKKHGATYDHEPTGRATARLERGIYATPMDAILVKGIRSNHKPVLEWKDGFVCLWLESAFDHIPMKEKKKQILYFNAKVFQAEHMGLTQSQLRFRFAKRARQPLEEDAREYLAYLKLVAVLDLGRKRKAAARFDKQVAELMERHFELESESLRKHLAAYPVWRKTREVAPDQIRAETAAGIRELEFWNAWAARNHWPLQQEQVEKFLSVLRNP